MQSPFMLPFFNVDKNKRKRVGPRIVQFRLNSDDRYIYTTHYDISEPKMYDAAQVLLKSHRRIKSGCCNSSR